MRLYRDGKPVLTGPPVPLTPAVESDPKRLLLDGTLRLDSDKLADEKYSTAAQWIDFSVHH